MIPAPARPTEKARGTGAWYRSECRVRVVGGRAFVTAISGKRFELRRKLFSGSWYCITCDSYACPHCCAVDPSL